MKFYTMVDIVTKFFFDYDGGNCAIGNGFFAVFLEFLGIDFGLKSENEFSPTFSWRRVTFVV